MKSAFVTAIPIMFGYLMLGLACGILLNAAGLSTIQVGLLSLFVYSGAGQFMLANMIIAGIPTLTMLASITLVNSRQMLYSSALTRFFRKLPLGEKFLASMFVTDETFGIGVVKLQTADWSAAQLFALNTASHSSWIVATMIGSVLADAVTIPLAIASFGMTSIFICLLFSQKGRADYIVAGIVAFVATAIVKFTPFSGLAILIGAVIGVIAGITANRIRGIEDGLHSDAVSIGGGEDAVV